MSLETTLASEKANPGPESRTYHHVGLRAALLKAAGEVLDEHGLENFTLRECARRAGVSHAAPAYHFGDVKGLLTAYAVEGFEKLEATMRATGLHAANTSSQALIEMGLAYIAFALDNAAQFTLMFRAQRVDRGDNGYHRASEAVYQAFKAGVASMVDGGDRSGHEAQRSWLLAFSAVHGIAVLMLDRIVPAEGNGPASEADQLQLAREMLSQLLPALPSTPAGNVSTNE